MLASIVRQSFYVASDAVAAKADEINKLNVFPVPDGDTGTNMSLTLQTVVKELKSLPEGASMADLAKAITHGSLMGARGNSGVITSQILRGLAEGLASLKTDTPSTADVAHALKNAQKVAFKAVRKPVRGTILTVVEDIAACAETAEKNKLPLTECLDLVVAEAYASVARTPELLPILKENGVVDSGAFGFATFVEAFVQCALGRDGELSQIQTSFDTDGAKAQVAAVVDIEINEDWEGSEYRYCTEFLFHADSPDFDEVANLKYLSSMGDCELLVGQNPDYKIHVHTNRPDRVLRHMLHRGQVYNVFVHNMDLEAQERTESIREDKAQKVQKELKELAVVAVAAGEGQKEILESLGVDVVISGGQTMNPSTADILSAVEEAHAKSCIILPNNSNIRMAAEAAAEAAEGQVEVVATKTVLQAFAAMFAFDADADLAENAEAMRESLEAVRDGEITTAVRDSVAADGSPIKDGDVMGIQNGLIEVVGSEVQDVCLKLISKMMDEEEADTLTILAGSDMADDDFEALIAKIQDAFEDLEIDSQRGEQPLYPVIFALE